MVLATRGKRPEKGESLQEGSNTTHTIPLRRTEEGGKGGAFMGRAPAMTPGALGSSPSLLEITA